MSRREDVQASVECVAAYCVRAHVSDSVTLSRHWHGGGGGAALMKIAITMVMLMMIDGRLTNETDCKD